MSRNQNIGSELGTWASTQAQPFWQMIDGAPQDQAQWHNLDILDFVSGAHGPAHKHMGYNLFILDFEG